mmetsp:Transcript_29281/g.77369  ORF Transcript_29281/g.77369 Transcript_29281/m.77369 type:complete len:171 (+) Transcript_29281:103-615(+)
MVSFCAAAPALGELQLEACGCPWCGGSGFDVTSGEACQGCNDAVRSSPASRRRSRRQRRSESAAADDRAGLASLRSFMAEAQDTPMAKRRQRLQRLAAMGVECGVGAGAEEGPGTPRASKVRFDLEAVLEYPVTPYAEKYAGLPNYGRLDDSDDNESSEEREAREAWPEA